MAKVLDILISTRVNMPPVLPVVPQYQHLYCQQCATARTPKNKRYNGEQASYT